MIYYNKITRQQIFNIFRQKKIKWLTVCIAIGICAYFFLPAASLYETDILISVGFDKIPSGLTITSFSPKNIEVRVRGPKSLIKDISNLKLQYSADLSDVSTGLNSIPVHLGKVGFPNQFSIINVNPAFLDVVADIEIYKKVPVEVFYTGEPASNFFVSDALAKPSSLILRGPEKLLHPIEKVLTKSININGISESFKKEITLDLPEDIDIVFPSGVIHAEIFLKEKFAIKKFSNIPVKGKNTKYSYSITPFAINIEIKGPVKILDKLKAKEEINVSVDLKGLKPGIYVRRAAITLPVKTTLASAEPEIFTVKIVQ
ncbi:MAG: YbbR-like domain-containing protein [Deltaproteobacteria bacterium]|nr:YbbR-like domain-containing protein [Deltaproteobacteria bacterium]